MIKNKIILTIAILIPFIMIAVTATSVAYFTHYKIPSQNFIFTTLDSYTQSACVDPLISSILVLNTAHLNKHETADCSKLIIYYYNFATNKITPISSEKAKQLVQEIMNKNISKKLARTDFSVSKDGFKIKNYCSQDIGLAWWIPQNTNSPCLVKEHYQSPLNLAPEQNAYKFKFIAWVN